MSKDAKRVEDLTVSDLEQHAVWCYLNDDQLGETMMAPVKRTPVKSLDGCLVGIKVRLANGSEVWALLGNVDAGNPRSSRHFLTLSVFAGAKSFTMARYHDFDAEESGPEALAKFLGLPVDEVFPISYDIARYAAGERDALVGAIEKEPREKLTRDEIMKLALGD
jgi:hypothetical protein